MLLGLKYLGVSCLAEDKDCLTVRQKAAENRSYRYQAAQYRFTVESDRPK
jgi:hypothetical protein